MTKIHIDNNGKRVYINSASVKVPDGFEDYEVIIGEVEVNEKELRMADIYKEAIPDGKDHIIRQYSYGNLINEYRI